MKKIITPLVILIVVLVSLTIVSPLFAVDSTIKLNVPIGETKIVGTKGNPLGEYIEIWYGFIIGSVGILATVMIMWGGFKWLTSRGNSSIIGEAKEIIWSALIGLFIAFLSYNILYLVNPDLLTIKPLTPKILDFKALCCCTNTNQTSCQVSGSTDGKTCYQSPYLFPATDMSKCNNGDGKGCCLYDKFINYYLYCDDNVTKNFCYSLNGSFQENTNIQFICKRDNLDAGNIQKYSTCEKK